MKVNTSPIVQSFKPLRIDITVESAEEMSALYHLISLGRTYASAAQANHKLVHALADELLPHFTRL